MEHKAEKESTFNKYATRGAYHWREMKRTDIRAFNAYHQAHYEWILKLAGDLKGKKVLDVGCGDGVLSFLLAQKGAEVTGLDNDEHGLRFAEENLKRENKNGTLRYRFVNGSAYEMPFESETFDIVVSCEVIEHVRKPEQLVSEAHRVLKKGGQVIITTPYRLTEVPLDSNHVKEYYPGELEILLEKKFNSASIKLTHNVFWYNIYTYGGLGNRPIGRWFINTLVLLFGWNPFMIDYKKPGKLTFFSTICVWGYK